MTHKYFTFHWDSGFDTYATEEEAKGMAQQMVDDEGDEASQYGWSEDAGEIYWGEIKQQSTMSKTGNMVMFEGEMTEAVEYKLEPDPC